MSQYYQPYSSQKSTIAIVSSSFIIVAALLFFVSTFFNIQLGFFQFFNAVAAGLFGMFKMLLPIFLCWLGVCFVPQQKFKTHALALCVFFLLFLQISALVNLLSSVRLVSSNETLKAIDAIDRLNFSNPNTHNFFSFLSASYRFCATPPYFGTLGGLFGMLLAWPFWQFLGYTWGAVVLVLLALATVGLFVKFYILNHLTTKTTSHYATLSPQEQYAEYLKYCQQMQEYYQKTAEQVQYTMAQNATTPYVTTEGITQANASQHNTLLYTPEEQEIQIKNPLPLKGKAKKTPKKDLKSLSTETPNDTHYNEPYVESEYATPNLNTQVKNFNKESFKRPSTLPQLETDNISISNLPIENEPLEDKKSVAYRNPNASVNVQSVQSITHREENEEDNINPQDFVVPTAPTSIFGDKQSGKRIDNLTPIFETPKEETHEPLVQKSVIPYVYPKSTLLDEINKKDEVNPAQDIERAQLLEDTLESFGITALVANVTHGPAVTRFELDLASGINIKRINNVAHNIALNMSAENGIRIEAPIPGTTYVGIEVPNKKISPVSFKEVMYSQEMLAEKDPLAIALGRDIAGKPIICNLAQMPHLLIAGATGSGKSVCINAIISSIVFRCSPEDCRLILIDPKMVELQRYNVLPHLLVPVVCEPHKASGALAWALAEMTDRYSRFKDCAVSDLRTYNANLPEGAEKLPRIVVVIDELADLMVSSSKKEIEHAINRIAAVARAAGIHLVVATQRPSVNVITGVIKANLLSRIAFLCSSAVDSRTIIDRTGAENLLGYGDMLYMPNGYKNPVRVQGCFLKNDEINRILAYIQKNSTPNYDPDACESIENAGEDDKMPDVDDNGKVDPLLEEAIDMVIADGQASISMLQRRMSIGYARAGRLIDAMTKRGIVSKATGSKPREVLLSREEFESIKDDIL